MSTITQNKPKGLFGAFANSGIGDKKGISTLFGKSAEFARIQPGQIVTQKQVRAVFEDDDNTLGDLAADIKANGIVQPLLVRPIGGEYELVCGERRLRAAIMAGLADVPVFIREMTDEEAHAAQVAENIQRMGLTILEEASEVKSLVDRLGSLQAAAEHLHKSLTWVSKKLKLGGLPKDSAARQVVQGGISADEEVIAGVATVEARNPQAAMDLVADLAANQGSRPARDLVNEAKKNVKKPTASKGSLTQAAEDVPPGTANTSPQDDTLENDVTQKAVTCILDNIYYKCTDGKPLRTVLRDVSEGENRAVYNELKRHYTAAMGLSQRNQIRALAKGLRDGDYGEAGAAAVRMAAFFVGTHKGAFDVAKIIASVAGS